MSFLPCTSRVIAEVERITNRPVHVVEDPNLKTLAHIQIARGDAPLHVLRYKPGGETPPDYLIVYQCGHLIRLYGAPVEKRFDIASCPEGRERMEIELRDRSLPPEVRGMGEMLLGGIITQLRSIPVGFRIDDWIGRTFPELADLQKQAALGQLQVNAKGLTIAASGKFPAKVCKANLSMNAAFAAFWNRRWSDPTVVVPYKATGLLEVGTRLLAICDRTPDDPAADTQMIHDWAFELKLRGWYDAIPFNGPA